MQHSSYIYHNINQTYFPKFIIIHITYQHNYLGHLTLDTFELAVTLKGFMPPLARQSVNVLWRNYYVISLSPTSHTICNGIILTSP